MSTTLYRKYRPQSFSEISNQNHIKITLQNEIEKDQISHAYLFCGPRGTGKTTTARILAKAANCLKRKRGESEPCNDCESCKEIVQGKSLDIIEIDAASHTGVDNVRENIINHSRFTPVKRKFKVFIIDEVHMLSTSAFNALLKILEEPPEYVIFILATTEVYRLPATIISRCQRFDFKKLSREGIKERLKFILKKEKKEFDDQILESIVRSADGSVRDAESLLGQVISLSGKHLKIEQAELVIPRSNFETASQLVEYFIKKNIVESLSLINRLADEGIDLEQFVHDLIELLRKILLAKISGGLSEFSLELEQDLEKKIISFSRSLETKELISIIELFLDKKREIRYSEIPQLPLELAIISLTEDSSSEEKKIPEIKKEESAIKKKDNFPINLDEVKEKWDQILKEIGQYNHSLPLVLKVSIPFKIEDSFLELGFKYKFHRERLEETKNKKIVEDILKRVLGKDLKVRGVILNAQEWQEQEKKDNALVQHVLDTFGGRLI